MNNKSGIYIIKNKINNKVYIGQSVDMQARWRSHIFSALHENRQDHYTAIHQAMAKYGIDNFYYESIEYCAIEEMDEKERYWIAQYNSCGSNGYNMTPGGESLKGEENGRAILTLAQVEEIRLAYNNHIPFRDVQEKYKDIISKRGLQKVWHFETWKHVMPEVYTDENRLWHTTNAKAHINGNKELGVNNAARACSEEEIRQMRELREQGLPYKEISKIVGRAESVVRKYCLFQENNNPNKIWNSIQIKNLETGLCFDSLSQASKWAGATRDTIKRHLDKSTSAGRVPTTGEPAHWKSL